MNATEEALRRYVEVLHATVRDSGAAALEADQAAQLLHNSLLPARITVYVSTQFGIAFEYVRAIETTIETIRGSARVEDLVFSGPKKLRLLPPMFAVEGHNSGIMGGGKIEGAFPFRLLKTSSHFTVSDIGFEVEALGWQRYVQFLEVYGDRSAARWSAEAAASRAKDEVLAAVYLARQASKRGAKLEDYVSNFRKTSVLLLGAYSAAGQIRLGNLAAALREVGYEPVLVADVPDFEHYDLSQKVVAIAAVSRFVVIDDSEPSGHLNEIELCKANRWVTVLLRANGVAASSMTLGASLTSKVIHELAYDPTSPGPALTAATQWAEQRLQELEEQLQTIYPYRMTHPPT